MLVSLYEKVAEELEARPYVIIKIVVLKIHLCYNKNFYVEQI